MLAFLSQDTATELNKVLDAGGVPERLMVSRALLTMLEPLAQECSKMGMKQPEHHSQFGIVGAQPLQEIVHTSPEAALQHYMSISSANSLLLRTTILSQLCARHLLLKAHPGVTAPLAAESSEVEASAVASSPKPEPHARPAFDFDAEVESCSSILSDMSTFLQSVQRFVLPEMAMFVANRPDSTQCMEDALHDLNLIDEVTQRLHVCAGSFFLH